MALKEEVKENVQSNYDATVDYMQQINNSFIAALEDEKKKKKHEQTMDAVLSLWLSLLFENFTNDIYTSAQIGIDIADKQLKELEITTVADKGITAETCPDGAWSGGRALLYKCACNGGIPKPS